MRNLVAPYTWVSYMYTSLSSIIGVALSVLTAVLFLNSEYDAWTDKLACDQKCELLGCQSGTLISGENRRDLLCRCDDDMDYLVILD